MKLKHILTLLGVSFSLAAVGAVGVAAGEKWAEKDENLVAVEAATSETVIYIDARETHWFKSWGATNANLNIKTWGDGGADKYHYDASTGRGVATISGVEYVTFDRTNYSAQTGGLIYAYNDSTTQNRSANFTFSSASAGQNLLTLSGGSDSTGPSLTWGTLDVGTTYSVNKYGVCDGDKGNKWIIETDTVSDGDTYAIPSRENLSGYHFGGWFTDDDCTVPYVAQTISDDLDIYAKYTTLSKDSYIYYITASSTATTDKIHSWAGDYELDGTITSISGVAEVHGVTRFRNTDYLIYKIPFSSESGDTAFKFYTGEWATESDEKTLVAGNAYQWGLGGIETDEAAGGDALDFILQFEAIRNNVAAAGDIKQYSVCGIVDDGVNNYASALCTAYNGLSSTARGYVDASYTYTYKRTDSSQNDNVTFYDMMEQVASQVGVTLEGHSARISLSTIEANTSNSVVLILVVTSIALVALGGFVVIRKRKHDN